MAIAFNDMLTPQCQLRVTFSPSEGTFMLVVTSGFPVIDKILPPPPPLHAHP